MVLKQKLLRNQAMGDTFTHVCCAITMEEQLVQLLIMQIFDDVIGSKSSVVGVTNTNKGWK